MLDNFFQVLAEKDIVKQTKQVLKKYYHDKMTIRFTYNRKEG